MTADRAGPANSSSACRCLAARSSCCWSAWPCTATRSSARPINSDTGTLRPPAYALDLPSAETERLTIRVRPSSSSSPPASSTCSATCPSGSIRSRPSTVARSAPGRTRAGSARPPNIRPRPVTTMVLPAPVSPVTTVNPEENSRTASSITPRPVMCTSSSIGGRLLLPVFLSAPDGTPTPAGNRQAELGHEPVGERERHRGGAVPAAAQPGQQDRLSSAAHLHPRTRREIDTPPPIAPQNASRRLAPAGHALVPGSRRRADDLHREHRPRRQHYRLGEQRVRADRDHQQGLYLRPDYGAAGRERVSRGPGRGGADDAVTGPARQRAAVDLGDHLDRPLASDLLHAAFVQCPGFGGGAVVPHRHVNGHPFFNRIPALHHLFDGAGQVVRLGLGEEADVAEVDAEQRRSGGPGHLGGAQQRAIAAEHDHHLGVCRRIRCRGHHIRAHAFQGGRLRREDTHAEPGRRQPVYYETGAAQGCRAARVGHHEHGALHCGPSTTARSSSSARRSGAPRHNQRKYSTLPAGPGSGLATRPATPSPSAAAAAATALTASRRSTGSRTTPPGPTRSLPTSNCGLTSSTKSASGVAQRTSAGRTRLSEMKERSAVTRSGAGATCCGCSWRTLTRSSTVTRSSERNAQASWPYPTSTAVTCAAPLRSSTSVKPPVDAPASRHLRPVTWSPGNAARAPASFHPPRDAYCGPAGSVTVIGSSGATCVAGLAAAWPATRTLRAVTRPAACSRDGASPLRTSSASSLRRVPMQRPRCLSAAGCARPRHMATRAAGPTRATWPSRVTHIQVTERLRQPLMHVLEHGRVLGNGQFRQVGEPGDGFIHPAVTGRGPRARRAGLAAR